MKMGEKSFLGAIFAMAILACCFCTASGQESSKHDEQGPCANRTPKLINGVEVPCKDVALLPSYLDGVNEKELDEIHTMNQLTVKLAQDLTDKDKHDVKEVRKHAFDLKKAADDLCKNVDCDKK